MIEEPKIDYNVNENPQSLAAPEMSKHSRLNKRLEKQGKKNLILSIAGIIIILFLLLRFGIPFIADLGFLSSQIAPKQSTKSDTNKSNATFLSPPSLNSTFDATNSAKIKISGSSITGNQVAIYLNGSLLKKVGLNSGSFEESITLSDGDNIIKAKAVDGNRESDFSDALTILFKNTLPNLSIDSVHDGDTVRSSPFNISGKTDPDTKVTVNNFWAIVDSQGGYSYSLSLQDGDNQIIVDAIDSAGNKIEKTIKITYSH